MARLEAPEALQRFRDNENRLDRFMNGTDIVTYTTTDGREVPSLSKLVKDFQTTINLAGTGWLAVAQEAAETAAQVKGEIDTVYANTVAFSDSLAASIAQVNQAKTQAQDWATSDAVLEGGLRSAKWYAENLSSGTVISFNGRSGVIAPQPEDYPIEFIPWDEERSVRDAIDDLTASINEIGTMVDQLFADVFALKNNFTVSNDPPGATGEEGAFWYQLEEV